MYCESLLAHSRNGFRAVCIMPLLAIAKFWNQPISIDWWMNKENMVYVCNWTLLNQKKEWSYVICMKINGTGDHHVKWNKPNPKDKPDVFSLTHKHYLNTYVCMHTYENRWGWFGKRTGTMAEGGRIKDGEQIWAKYMICMHEDVIRKLIVYN